MSNPSPNPEVKRHPVNYRFNALNWHFLRLMAEIASYADAKYEDAEQYVHREMTREASPVNHMAEHLRQYITNEPYDHFDGDRQYHLAAIAYNAMMEYFYYVRRGRRVPESPVNQWREPQESQEPGVL